MEVLGKILGAKLVLLGDNSVGKSAVAIRLMQDEFPSRSLATIGADLLHHIIRVHGQSVKLNIIDTAGNERFDNYSRAMLRAAQAVIVVYDITNTKSFDKAVSWIKELRQQATDMLIVLAGNKLDRAAKHRAVQTEEARAFAEKNGLNFFECSAKSGDAVNEIFLMIAHKLFEGQITEQEQEQEQDGFVWVPYNLNLM